MIYYFEDDEDIKTPEDEIRYQEELRKEKGLQSVWCGCPNSNFLLWVDDNQCKCGMEKHHAHCRCGKICQVG